MHTIIYIAIILFGIQLHSYEQLNWQTIFDNIIVSLSIAYVVFFFFVCYKALKSFSYYNQQSIYRELEDDSSDSSDSDSSDSDSSEINESCDSIEKKLI